ncbi:MAG: SLBB domain-containing protein [Phormidesmis sp. CAN_BIN44]|nr:SLBB domain-containing protein [Phormidesmis sp. CAN_BIN44]
MNRQFSKQMNRWTRSSFFIVLSSVMAVPVIAQTPPRANPAVLRPAASPIPIDQGYLLGAGDKIKLDIFSVPEYSGDYQVLADGTLNLPLAGSVTVQDLSLKDASAAISRKLSEWLTRPIVTVSLLASRPINVAVSGEVTRPGSYTTTLTEGGIPTLTKMLQLAGGMSQSADLQRVQVVRRLGRGGTQTRTVDLRQLLRTGDISQDLPLRDGDSIVVPAATAVNVDDANLIASSSFAVSTDQPLRIIVAGEVNRPGPHSIKSEAVPQAQIGSTAPTVGNKVQVPTVTRALQIAGGITQSANIREIEVRRRTNAGSEQVLKVNLFELLQAGDSRQDMPLQEGDRVIVPTATTLSPADAAILARASFSPDSIAVNVVGEVTKPGLVQLPPNTTLNQALLAAGGFNARAKKREVSFLRLNSNGTVDRRNIAINFNQGINEQSNPPLRNNDTIVVGKSGLAGIGDTLGTVFAPLSGFLGIFNIFR